MEDRKWEYEDRLADAVERNTTAESRGMHGFLSNLLTKNIAMGADVETSAVSAYTAGSSRQQQKLREEAPVGEDAETEYGRDTDTKTKEDKGGKRPYADISDSPEHRKGDSDDGAAGQMGPPVVSSVESTSHQTEPSAPSAQEQAAAKEAEEAKKKGSREEAIRAAKERFAARKKKQEAMGPGGEMGNGE